MNAAHGRALPSSSGTEQDRHEQQKVVQRSREDFRGRGDWGGGWWGWDRGE